MTSVQPDGAYHFMGVDPRRVTFVQPDVLGVHYMGVDPKRVTPIHADGHGAILCAMLGIMM